MLCSVHSDEDTTYHCFRYVELLRSKDRFHPTENWFGPDGDPFAPQTMYALGGNTKIWGGVLERMREKDFGALPLQEGVSPQWELSYGDVAPYYDKAEQLYQVHGRAGGVRLLRAERRRSEAAPPARHGAERAAPARGRRR
mgnify:CR=1 FL=1